MLVKLKKNLPLFIWHIIIGISLFTTICILCDTTRPNYYGSLFLLPLTYGILSFIFLKLYYNISKNLGMSIILILFFCRMVLSPLAMYYGSYQTTITYNIGSNTTKAILLVIYEAIAVFITLYVKNCKTLANTKLIYQDCILKINTVYKILIFTVVIVFLICLYITPQIMDIYRTIFEISDKNFTSYEDAYLVSKYSVSFISKLSLVTGVYLSRALLLLLPAFFIVQLAVNKTTFQKFLAKMLCLVPIFFIGGAIAMSLIYVVCLMFLYNYMFVPQKATKKQWYLLVLCGVLVVAWWLFKGDFDDLSGQFSGRLSAYFSSVNVVSGVFNLPRDIKYRIKYFLYDFASTFPYGNTIFRISDEPVHYFFNMYNFSMGQIPPTIGMGYYYFGPILAPIYSVIFTNVAFGAGSALNSDINQNPMKCIRYLITAFYFSMGIVMYNIEITMTHFFTLILPMYLLEKIAYTKE